MTQLVVPKQRHHFVPQFYLRHWYEPGKEGFWLYFRDPAGKIALKHRPAGSVAYVENLYSIQPDGLNLRESVSQDIESEFFTPIDMAASVVHEKLVTQSLASLTTEDRHVWAIFVNSLIERSPGKIRALQKSAEGFLDASVAGLEHRHRVSANVPRMLALVARIDKSAAGRNAVLSVLPAYVTDLPFIEYAVSMRWVLIDLPTASDDHFLTSDNPVVVNGGSEQTPIHLIMVAISPSRLLVMHRDTSEFNEEFIRQLAVLHSMLVVEQSERYVVSSRSLTDDGHIKYSRIVDRLLK